MAYRAKPHSPVTGLTSELPNRGLILVISRNQ
jgi:hypothetical protein